MDKLEDGIDISVINIPVYTLTVFESMGSLQRRVAKLMSKKTGPCLCDFIAENDSYNRKVESGKTEDTAVIVYTSGTTGDAKGVLLSNCNLNSVAIMCFNSGKNYKVGEEF